MAIGIAETPKWHAFRRIAPDNSLPEFSLLAQTFLPTGVTAH